MGKMPEPDAIVASLLCELDAARARIPPTPPRRAELAELLDDAWKAVALSDEVERLCRRACLTRDGAQAEALLKRAHRKLRALRDLLEVR